MDFLKYNLGVLKKLPEKKKITWQRPSPKLPVLARVVIQPQALHWTSTTLL